MCEFSLYSFNCPGDHYQITRARLCHYSRNRPKEPCRRVQELKRVWPQVRPCPDCDPEYEERLGKKEYTKYTHELYALHIKTLQLLGSTEYNTTPDYRPSYAIVRERLIKEKGVEFVERYHPYKPPPKSQRRRQSKKTLTDEEMMLETEKEIMQEIEKEILRDAKRKETGEPYGEGNCGEDRAEAGEGKGKGQVQDEMSGSSGQRGLFDWQPPRSSQQLGQFYAQPGQGYGQQQHAEGYSDGYAQGGHGYSQHGQAYSQHGQGYPQQSGQDYDQQYEAAYGGSYQPHGQEYAQRPGEDHDMDMEYEGRQRHAQYGEGQTEQAYEGYYTERGPSGSGSGRAGKQPR